MSDEPKLKTLGDYYDLCMVITEDKNSKAVKFFANKIAKQGREELVLADESQMMALLASMLVED